ncbi:MAG: hypothetical protein KJZ69_11365 [Phycisphaerales bacterium]|nr:hypothetical protein [Phycisphaerales bacterium]
MSARRSRGFTRWSLCAAGALALWSAPALAQPVLTLEGSCPGRMLAQVSGSSPRGVVRLYFSPHRGSYAFPPFHPCYGVEIGLDPRRIQHVGTTRADQAGIARFNGDAGPAACGGFLQAMSDFCEVTNVVQIE